MKLKFKNNPCETHLQVETSDDWCPYCLKEERDRLRSMVDILQEQCSQLLGERNNFQDKYVDENTKAASLRAELAQAREEIAELYSVIHDMDNARLEVRRGLENLIVKTGNAYKPEPPGGDD